MELLVTEFDWNVTDRSMCLFDWVKGNFSGNLCEFENMNFSKTTSGSKD
jgi:hypothetical protein